MTYRVAIDTGTARRQAADVRRAIETELKTINTGNIKVNTGNSRNGGGIPGLDNKTAGIGTAVNNSIASLNKTLGIFGIALGAVQLYKFVTDLGRLQTEAARAQKSFEVLSGGAGQATANLNAIQQASGGTVSSLEAIKIGNQAAALSLAATAEEFGNITRSGRIVALLSPVINDVSSALTELGLASANLSYRRLDQLALSVTEVREGMAALRAENGDLSDSQAFLLASMAALEAKGGEILESTEAQATGFEKLGVAIAEARRAMAEGIIGNLVQGGADFIAGSFNELNVLLSGVSAEASVVKSALDEVTDAYKNQSSIVQNLPLVGDRLKQDREAVIGQLQLVGRIFDLSNDAFAEDPALLGYQQQIKEIVTSVTRWGFATDAQVTSLQNLYTEMLRQKELNAPQAAAESAAEAEARAEDARLATVFEQADPIKKDLFKQAKDSIGDLGIDKAVELYKQERSKVDNALQELADSGVADAEEIALRATEIMGTFSQAFTDASEEAQNFAFDGFEQSFTNIFDKLNFPEIDFIPYLEDIRDQAIDLYQEIGDSGYLTEENATQLDYLSSVASATADETSNLTAVIDELGEGFLEQNQLAGDLIGQLYATQGAFNAGQISAEEFAGRTAALGGQLLAYIQQVGGATSATYALIAAQSGMQGTPGFITGFTRGDATNAYLKAQDDARSRDQARKDAEKARKDAESAAKKAAREAESAAKRAGRELEAGAKKARQELESALKSVPGLFGRSQVTQEQIDQAKGGVPQNFADDYLRRLQDEVENGKDWADVSIDEARSALEALGVQVSADNKVAFQQFVEAWESGLLFFDAENIAKFINEEAVKASIDLQEKARIGQENIMKAFGVAIDDAADAAVSGIGAASGGSSGSFAAGDYTIPVTAELVPIPQKEFEPGGAFAPPVIAPEVRPVQGPLPQSAYMPTLGGMSPVIDVAAIQGQLDELTVNIVPTIDTDSIDFTLAAMAIKGNLTPTIIPVINAAPENVDYDTPYSQIAANLVPTIYPKVDAGADVVDYTLAAMAIKGNLTPTIIPVINAAPENVNYGIVGATIAEQLKVSIASNVATTEWNDDGIVAPIAAGLITAINTQVRGTQEGFKREGQNVATIVMHGLSQGWREVNGDGSATNSLAMGLLSELNTQLSATQNFFFASGQAPAINMIEGYKNTFSGGSEDSSSLVAPMLTSIGTGIRANIEGFRQRGGTVAREMISGFSAQFSNEEFKNTLIAAGETMGLYLEIGILSRIRGGSLVEAIGAQVLADIAATVEEPTP